MVACLDTRLEPEDEITNMEDLFNLQVASVKPQELKSLLSVLTTLITIVNLMLLAVSPIVVFAVWKALL